QSFETHGKRSLQAERPTSQPPPVEKTKPAKYALHRRSQSATLLDMWTPESGASLLPPEHVRHQRTSSPTPAIAEPRKNGDDRPIPSPTVPAAVPRDRYGFKKISHHITAAQYDAWDVQYSEHLDRRTKKWHALMQSYGLDTASPYRFPPKSDKIKRYVRKGIPPALRGAAWFWYAGGPSRQKRQPGLYKDLLKRVED
ncbi:hypothetical protein LTR53_018682, partial [Teratosphaeriaceae sp. CCFEE 6253]